MTKYIIVPHGKREIANVTLKTGDSAEIRYDGKSEGYGSRNEDPFVRYRNAWFYSFCHTNQTFTKEIRGDIEDIIFVFMALNKGDTWTIDTVINLKKLISIDKKDFEITREKKALSKVKMDDIVNGICDELESEINLPIEELKEDVKEIIAKYHLPKFYKEYNDVKPNDNANKLADNEIYNGESYLSEEHNKPASPVLYLGLADMSKSYFPMKKENDGKYKCINFEYEGLTKKIKHTEEGENGNFRYYVIKSTGKDKKLMETLDSVLNDPDVERITADRIDNPDDKLIIK